MLIDKILNELLRRKAELEQTAYSPRCQDYQEYLSRAEKWETYEEMISFVTQTVDDSER